jgi:hypothetical protein
MEIWLLIMVDGSGLLVPERILSLISYVSSPPYTLLSFLRCPFCLTPLPPYLSKIHLIALELGLDHPLDSPFASIWSSIS